MGKLTQEKIDLVRKLRDKNVSIADVVKLADISRGSVYNLERCDYDIEKLRAYGRANNNKRLGREEVKEDKLPDLSSTLKNIENFMAEILKIQAQLLQMEHNKQENRNKRYAQRETRPYEQERVKSWMTGD